MTIRAIAGLVALNLAFVVVGAGMLWGLRGWRWWTEIVRLSGLAYLLGVASVTTVLTLGLVAGIPFRWPMVVLSCCVLAGSGLALGWRRKRARPLVREPGRDFPRLTFLGALWTAAIVLYFEALFRSGRLEGLSEWDAWRCWTLRGKAIFYFDGLDPAAFDSPRCPGYPPGFSALEAAGFHAMGSVDVVTLHLQYWFLAAGFVAALAGLLVSRVRQSILLPFLLLPLVMPSFTDRVTDGRTDLPLAYGVVVGAVLVVLWLEDGQSWRLPAATLLFAGALMTKREGLLLVAFVFAAALVSSWGENRRTWPPLAASAVASLALSVPWRIWLAAEEHRSGAPPDGYLGVFDHLDRAWPSLSLVVRTAFDYELWLLATPIALAAAALGYLADARRPAIFALAFAGVSVLGCTWAIWSEPDLEITQDYGLNPVVRLVGAPIFVLVALAPLLLERALSSERAARRSRSSGHAPLHVIRNIVVPWGIVLAATVAYPASMLVGYSGLRLPGGAPTFPSAEECTLEPVAGRPVRVVFGYTGSYADANALRARARTGGFPAVDVAQDGCGRLRVFLDGISSVSDGDRLANQAVTLGFQPTLELDPDG